MQTVWRAHRPLVVFAGLMAALVVVSIVGLVIDDRSMVGAPLWAKPFKFALSLGIYAITWAWLLSLQTQWRRLGWWLGNVIALAGLVEIVIIVGQQVREHRSHFNFSTPVDGILWTTMGISIGVLFVANVIWTVLLWRQPLLDGATSWALRLGAAVSLLGLAVAFLMTSPKPGQIEAAERGEPMIVGAHSVGVADGGPGLPLLGWSTTGGDLRIAHFIGMHALQIVPLASVVGFALLKRYGRLTVSAQYWLVGAVAAGYTGVLAVVTDQALRGEPLVRPGAMTIGELAAVLGLAAIGLGTSVAVGRDSALKRSLQAVRS